jgi:hypothetical protein
VERVVHRCQKKTREKRNAVPKGGFAQAQRYREAEEIIQKIQRKDAKQQRRKGKDQKVQERRLDAAVRVGFVEKIPGYCGGGFG